MTDSNLPPGVSERDIPGNRPEDEAAEKLADTIVTAMVDEGFDEAFLQHTFARPIIQRIAELAQTIGYTAGWEDHRQEAEQFPHPLRRIADERLRQLSLKEAGKFRYTPSDSALCESDRFALLTQEVLEVSQEVENLRGLTYYEGSQAALYNELTQVAAICVAWLEREPQ